MGVRPQTPPRGLEEDGLNIFYCGFSTQEIRSALVPGGVWWLRLTSEHVQLSAVKLTGWTVHLVVLLEFYFSNFSIQVDMVLRYTSHAQSWKVGIQPKKLAECQAKFLTVKS